MKKSDPQFDYALPVFLSSISGKWKLFQFILITFSILWIIVTVTSDPQSDTKFLQIPHQGFSAPDFHLNNLSNQEIDFQDFQGQGVILNFWATWCPPCKAEMPDLQQIYLNFHGRGLVVIGINRTDQEIYSDIAGFLATNEITFPVLLDPSGEIAKMYNVSALPTTFFIQPDGIIHKVIVGGPLPQALLLSEVQQIIQGNP